MKTVIEHGVEITLTDKEYKQYQKERKKILEEVLIEQLPYINDEVLKKKVENMIEIER